MPEVKPSNSKPNYAFCQFLNPEEAHQGKPCDCFTRKYFDWASVSSHPGGDNEGLMPLEFDHIICCAMMSLDHEAAHRPCARTRCLLMACWSSYICTNKHYVYKDCRIDGMTPDCPSVNCTELVGSHLPLYFLYTSCHHYSPLSYHLVRLLLRRHVVVFPPCLLPRPLLPTSSPWEPAPPSLKEPSVGSSQLPLLSTKQLDQLLFPMEKITAIH